MLQGLTDEQVAVLTSPNREIRLYAAVGIGIDQTSADDLTFDSTELMPIANIEQAANAVYTIDRIATFEGEGMSMATGQAWLCAQMDPTTDTAPEQAIWLDSIADANGAMDDTLTLTFGGVAHTSSLTLYFDEDNIPVDFTIKFYEGTTLNKTHTVTDNEDASYTAVEDGTPIVPTYDKIVINITKVAVPYSHARIAEIEFGASYTVGSEYIGSGTSIIYTYDPLGLAQSPDELDLSYINIGGIFDTDNPAGTWRSFSKENSITLSITCKATVNGKTMQVSAPMGKFYIMDTYVTGSTFNVTAMDVRALMQDIAPVVTFNKGGSIGGALKAIMTLYGLGVAVDTAINDLTFEKEVKFTGDTDLLTIMQYVVQYADVLSTDRVEMYTDRYGMLTVGTKTRDTYGAIVNDQQFDYPYVDTYDSYNTVSVKYGAGGEGTGEMLARKDLVSSNFGSGSREQYTPSRELTVPEENVTIDNPFIATLEQAQTLAEHIMAGMMTSCKATTIVGDVRMDPSDVVQMQTRFTAIADAPKMVVTEMEYTYTGSLRCTVKGCVGDDWQ